MIEILVGIVLLGVWHAILVRLGAVAPWARSAIRVVLGLAIIGETGRFFVLETLPWRTRGVPPAEMQEALGRSMETAFWLDTAVATALTVATGALLVLTGARVWRSTRGGEPPSPAAMRGPKVDDGSPGSQAPPQEPPSPAPTP